MKSIFASKTAWLNVILGILPVIGANVPAVSFLADAQTIATIAAVLNILMRFITKEPVTLVSTK